MAEPGGRKERGAALMTVLLLVAVMGIITAPALERLTLATRLARNGAALDQARAAAAAAELLATAGVGDLVAANRNRTTLEGGWLGSPRSVAVPGGTVTARLLDGGNCFNLNSVVSGSGENLSARPAGITQFRGLMELAGVDPRAAATIAPALADWIDSDTVPMANGAEDDIYARMPTPYRTANTLMVDASELRAVAGVTPAIYRALRPHVCALPTSDLSSINVNTLLPDQAVLLAMLLPGRLNVDAATALIARRPADGYESAAAFWQSLSKQGLTADADVAAQVRVSTRWFDVDIAVDMGDSSLHEHALIDAIGPLSTSASVSAAYPLLLRRSWDAS